MWFDDLFVAMKHGSEQSTESLSFVCFGILDLIRLFNHLYKIAWNSHQIISYWSLEGPSYKLNSLYTHGFHWHNSTSYNIKSSNLFSHHFLILCLYIHWIILHKSPCYKWFPTIDVLMVHKWFPTIDVLVYILVVFLCIFCWARCVDGTQSHPSLLSQLTKWGGQQWPLLSAAIASLNLIDSSYSINYKYLHLAMNSMKWNNCLHFRPPFGHPCQTKPSFEMSIDGILT